MNSNFPLPPPQLSVSTCLPPCGCLARKNHLVVTPRYLGLGCDRIIGGPGGPHYRVIDLSQLKEPVTIHWCGRHSGSITDGADSLVFQGVEQIILPPCMRPEPQQQAA